MEIRIDVVTLNQNPLNMEQGTLMLVLGAVILNCLLLFVIIQSASKSQKRYNMQVAIYYMLAKIAKKNGVDEKEIDELTEWMKKA